jgi:hypothetical protein
MLRLSDGAAIYYEVDDFRDPWLPEPDVAVVMTHGFARNHRFLPAVGADPRAEVPGRALRHAGVRRPESTTA